LVFCYKIFVGDIPIVQRVTVYGSSVVEVVWELPYPQRMVIGFSVHVSNNVNSEIRTISVDIINIYNISNLQPSTTYTITVAARFSDSTMGDRSQPMTVTIMTDDTTSKYNY